LPCCERYRRISTIFVQKRVADQSESSRDNVDVTLRVDGTQLERRKANSNAGCFGAQAVLKTLVRAPLVIFRRR
jgi:hypothetical protein